MIFIQLEPHTSSAGRVADLTLSYRVPNSTERITETVTLDYDRDPSEMLENPYLSYPAMSERYAMYNMFLGFRLATDYAVSDWSCAAATLSAVRTNAATWGERYTADEDIAADLVLLDKFLANLRAAGTFSEGTLDRCSGAGNPYPDNPPWPETEPQWENNAHCSTSNANAGWLVLLGVVLLVLRRRRR
jgi:MYXO-CTERM domain-containing protein